MLHQLWLMFIKNNHKWKDGAAMIFICPVWSVIQVLVGNMVSTTFGSLMDHVHLLHFQKSVTFKVALYLQSHT